MWVPPGTAKDWFPENPVTVLLFATGEAIAMPRCPFVSAGRQAIRNPAVNASQQREPAYPDASAAANPTLAPSVIITASGKKLMTSGTEPLTPGGDRARYCFSALLTRPAAWRLSGSIRAMKYAKSGVSIAVH